MELQSSRVFVGNLPYEVRWQDLKDFMGQAGLVAHADVLMGANGSSRGCGVVEYQDIQGAQNAIEQLQGQPLMGRAVFIREDRDPHKALGARGSGNSRDALPNAVFVENLSYSTNWADLKDHFRTAGNVLRADVHSSQNRSKGRGTVVFEDEAGVQAAISQLNGSLLHGRNIRVREDLPQSERQNAPIAPAFTPTPSSILVVNNLPWSTSDEQLAQLVASVTPVISAKIQFLPNGKSAGYGLVETPGIEYANLAIEQLNGYSFGDRKLVVSYGS